MPRFQIESSGFSCHQAYKKPMPRIFSASGLISVPSPPVTPPGYAFGQQLPLKHGLIEETEAACPHGDYYLMKHRVSWLFAVTASLAIANIPATLGQSSPYVTASPAGGKSGKDPIKSTTKPLTPKSAMPTPRKSAPITPAATGAHTSSELGRLERSHVRASNSKPDGSSVAKVPPIGKSSDTTPSQSMNFKYQKPAGGLQASNPNANAKNSTVPRVNPK